MLLPVRLPMEEANAHSDKHCLWPGVRMWCQRTQRHLQLRGTCSAKKLPWTQIAEPYPRGLRLMLAAAVSTAVGWTKKDRLNVAACSKTGTLRAGEARKPGPRPKRTRPNLFFRGSQHCQCCNFSNSKPDASTVFHLVCPRNRRS